ncbi:MAG: EAL domain-containing protein [Butyrivibrio sp.]|nr:EAL domain-containing protein [Butyrivibrio sp.]
MEFLINPQHYNACFSVASLVLLVVILIIYLSEDYYYGKQSAIFGVLIFNGIVMNVMGLIHNLWSFGEGGSFVSYDTNCAAQIIERFCIYIMAYYSMAYVLAIFHIDPPNLFRKLILVLPSAYPFMVIASGFFSDYFYSFDSRGEFQYHYPQAGTINLGIWLYFIFGAYLLIKYAKTLSSEKFLAILMYYILMFTGIPVRILTRSSSIFEFSVSIAMLLCVYTFQNPSEFMDRFSGTGTRKALDFSISTNLLQKKAFTLLIIYVDKLSVIIGSEQMEVSSGLLTQLTRYFKSFIDGSNVFYIEDGSYALIIPDVNADNPVIGKTSDQIKKRFKDPWVFKDDQIKLFVSTCAISFPNEINSLERYNEIRGVIRKALARLSRDMIRVTDLNLKYVEHDKKIDNIVKHALEDKILEVYYQPIYCPEKGKYTTCEALVRLKDPQLGFISPAVFMPVAERNGSVLAIDKFVLDSVCKMITSTGVCDMGVDFIEVNLSIVDCIQTNMADNILSTLQKHGVSTDRINFELTETWEKDITSVVDENIDKLLKAGVKFSMDDFGTGYSNIARISNLPVNVFKLDKSIIQSAFDSETSYMVMLNMIKIIKSLGKEIVAEGAETEEQAKQIMKLGCDYIQGFYYSRPLPADKFIEFIAEHNK